MNEEQVKNTIGEERWDEFQEWMRGQTVSINPDGSTEYYAHDVKRFIAQDIMKEPWD